MIAAAVSSPLSTARISKGNLSDGKLLRSRTARRSGNRALFKLYEGPLVSRPIQLDLLAAGNYGISGCPLGHWASIDSRAPLIGRARSLLLIQTRDTTSIRTPSTALPRVIKTDPKGCPGTTDLVRNEPTGMDFSWTSRFPTSTQLE